jgi:hypothetical protein
MLNTVSTDDAYVNGHVTFVAPRVAGQVSRVLVDDNYRVKTGDLLVQLDKEPYQVQVVIKKAAVGAAEADLTAAQAQVRSIAAQARANRFQLEHAIEAIAETMSLELREFGLEVATINPGPFLTGFNDRGFETWKSWEDDPSERLFDYSKLAFPRAQFDPEPVYATMTAVAAGEIDTYRNLEPKSMLAETKGNIEAVWDKKIRDGLGTRPPSVQKSYEMKPETPVE